MRITQRAMGQTSLRGLTGNLTAIQRLQQQLTSGKNINRPSDSPTGTNASMLTRSDIASSAQQARNISDGQTFLGATDTALQTMLDQVRRVQQLAINALNDGAQSDASLKSIATEVSGVRDSLLGTANQVVQGKPLFGGATDGTKAYDATSGAYVGIGGPGTGVAVRPDLRQISDRDSIRVDLTGPEAFGQPGNDLFAIVKNIADHVSDPVTGAYDGVSLSADLDALSTTMNQMLSAASDVGTRAARLDTAAQVNSSDQLTLQGKLSQTDDVDLPKTIMELQMQQVGYQAALSVTAKTLQPTLMDFLK